MYRLNKNQEDKAWLRNQQSNKNMKQIKKLKEGWRKWRQSLIRSSITKINNNHLIVLQDKINLLMRIVDIINKSKKSPL